MVSVIIPTYNRAYILRRSVDSVLNQTYRDIEVIIVDDGSTDGTDALVESMTDDRVRYIRIDHAGACAARNAGIDEAKGEYIAFQDSDDVWHPDKLEKQMDALEKNDADVVFCNYLLHRGPEELVIPNLKKSGMLSPNELLPSPKSGTPAMLLKREVLAHERFDPGMPKLEDYELVVRLCVSNRFYFMNEILLDAYIQQENSVSNQLLPDVKAKLMILERDEKIFRSYPEAYAKFCRITADGLVRADLPGAGRFYLTAFRFGRKRKYLLKGILETAGLLRLIQRIRKPLK